MVVHDENGKCVFFHAIDSRVASFDDLRSNCWESDRGLRGIVPKKGVRKCVCAQINDFSYYPNGVGDPSSCSFGKKPEVYRNLVGVSR